MYLFILPALLAIFNLFFAILPANAPRKKDVVYLADPAAQMQKPNLQLPVAFAVADPVLTYAEMWQMGSVYGFRNQTLFLFCCGEVNGAAKLRKWMAGQGSFFLVSDALDDRLDKILIDERIKFSSIQEAAGEIQHAWMPSSIYFSRPADYHVRKKLKVFFVERTGAGS